MNKNNLKNNEFLSAIHLDKSEGQNLSHKQGRAFQATKLNPPRDFIANDWAWIESCNSDKADNVDKADIVLEIGAGKGMHAMQFAQANPNTKIIAIERTANKFEAFAKSVAEKKSMDAEALKNLYPVHADAIAWTVFAIPAQSLSQIFILYPNPERNNANQQWLNMPFFEFLLSRLQDGGTITLASNIIDYIDNAEVQSLQTWQLPTIRQLVTKDSQRTHFEIKYLARGEVCEQLVMTKPAGYKTRFDTKA